MNTGSNSWLTDYIMICVCNNCWINKVGSNTNIHFIEIHGHAKVDPLSMSAPFLFPLSSWVYIFCSFGAMLELSLAHLSTTLCYDSPKDLNPDMSCFILNYKSLLTYLLTYKYLLKSNTDKASVVQLHFPLLFNLSLSDVIRDFTL